MGKFEFTGWMKSGLASLFSIMTVFAWVWQDNSSHILDVGMGNAWLLVILAGIVGAIVGWLLEKFE